MPNAKLIIPSEQALWMKVDRIEQDGPMDLEAVDYTLNNPEAVAQLLGHVLTYFCRVELEVERYSNQVKMLLPRANEMTQRFVKAWEAQEIPHGMVFAKLLEQLGISVPAIDADNVGRTMKVAGAVNNTSKSAHQMSLFGYLWSGSIQEQVTMAGYRLLTQKFTEQGEEAIVKTALRPIRKQEPWHADYYYSAAEHEAAKMPLWQRFVVGQALSKTWHFVGAHSQEQQRDFALVGRTLFSDDLAETSQSGRLPTMNEGKVLKFVRPIQNVADSLSVVHGISSVEELSPRWWDKAIIKFVGDKDADTPHPPQFVLNEIIEAQRALELEQGNDFAWAA